MSNDAIVSLIILCLIGISILANIIFVIVLIWMQGRNKKTKTDLDKVAKERDAQQKILKETERMTIQDLREKITNLENKKRTIIGEAKSLEQRIQQRKKAFESENANLDRQIAYKKQEIIVLDDQILLQSFGVYQPKYELQNSQLYKARLDEVRDKQQAMIKSGKAASCETSWTVHNSQKEGERMANDYIKLILRSFNNECDASIINVKFHNVESIEKKIRKAFDTLNNLGKRMTIILSQEYLNLKLQELYLYHEYQVKKQDEKEEQKRIREQMREDAKVIKQIEEAKIKIEKEERHFAKALEIINAQLQNVTAEAEKIILEKERNAIQQKLTAVAKDKEDVFNREQNTRAGYVYIISNIGSFGENVYKIGVTRRLDPQDRVDELGDASVPFDFDIHALIFSDDAPSLENALHKAFESRRLNLINRRREFFKVSLQEIMDMVKRNFNKPVEFDEAAAADEYRQSLLLKQMN